MRDKHEPTLSSTSMVMVKNLGAMLHKRFPISHQWGIHVNEPGGIIAIKNFVCHPNWGVIAKIEDLSTPEDYKKVMTDCGELLERFHISRSQNWEDDAATIQRDARGDGVIQH